LKQFKLIVNILNSGLQKLVQLLSELNDSFG